MANYLDYLDEYKKGTQNNNTGRKTYDLKNYFNTYLPDGVNSLTKTIRILKYDVTDRKFWGEMYAHKKEVEPKKWRTFTCIKHEKGEECPFCETRKMLLDTGKESDKELAKKFSARKMYILKVIDRDKEHEGVKFWRFNHSYDNSGTLDKILSAINAAGEDIIDYENGRDLKIEIKRNQLKKPMINSINYAPNKSKLSDDQDLMEQWSNDDRTWEDVYSVKDYNYLSIIAMGKTPTWDKEQEKFVAKEDQGQTNSQYEEDDYDSELTMGNNQQNTEASSQNQESSKKDDDFDDLPF
jgi:hypothetical protein